MKTISNPKNEQFFGTTQQAEFNVWWQENFRRNENFQSLSNKMQHDFKAIAWEAWKAAKITTPAN